VVCSKDRKVACDGKTTSAVYDRYLIKALERIGKFADQQYQGGGLRVGFGSALFPFLESSFVDPQLAGEDGTGAAQ
jgi:hypothetical protein